MPPSGDYLPCIASVDAMVVIDFGAKKTSCGVVKSLFGAAFKRHETDPLLSSLKRQAA
jgi:hypothetical protein